MSRLISKLPEPIRALAEKRRSEQRQSSDVLRCAFYWDDTLEKSAFWTEIKK